MQEQSPSWARSLLQAAKNEHPWKQPVANENRSGDKHPSFLTLEWTVLRHTLLGVSQASIGIEARFLEWYPS